jgi:hypothetical protein
LPRRAVTEKVERMKGDIAITGFMMTAEEWQALDAASRAELVDVIKTPKLANGSGPIEILEIDASELQDPEPPTTA